MSILLHVEWRAELHKHTCLPKLAAVSGSYQ